MAKVKSVYGFQKSTFDLLKEKAKTLSVQERHGVLLIDEMKLTSGIQFDKNTLEVKGFVDLGKYTHPSQKQLLGNHALVLMFQPLRGKWIQAIACFLTKNNATGLTLSKLIVECVFLLEQAGFHVDVVTTDGATWNRKMWDQFGINSQNASCQHRADKSRRLWFASDSPHLMKCARNILLIKKSLQVPEGLVKHSHWVDLMEEEIKKALKYCPRLTYKHIFPKPFEKMNVRMTFQFFSQSVAAAMTLYKEQGVDLIGLEDCDPTVAFIKRIGELADAMNSERKEDALTHNCRQQKVLEDFLIYLDLWEASSTPDTYLSKSTSEGLRVTIRTTSELFDYLRTSLGYKYLMTARLNQDALVHFFGMIRAIGGDNVHPESTLFARLFRLLAIYSLVKPPRGSNVSGGTMIQSLLKADDTLPGKHENRKKLESKLDAILDSTLVDDLEDIGIHIDNLQIHVSPDEYALAYLSGYIARKSSKWTKCNDCQKALIGPGGNQRDRLIELKSRGSLTFPSDQLYGLLQEVEGRMLNVTQSETMNKNIILTVVDKGLADACLLKVGCKEHQAKLTKDILCYFLVTRMYFNCKKFNNDERITNKRKELAKEATFC